MSFFKRKEFVNNDLMQKISSDNLEELREFINGFGEEPALDLKLQAHPGFLLSTLVQQDKTQLAISFLEDKEIQNRYQFISMRAYQQILASKNEALIEACEYTLKNCPCEKSKTLLLYPRLEKVLSDALDSNPKLKKKVMKAWQKVNIDELVILHQFLQCSPNTDDIAHFFKGGLFAIQDGGELRKFFQENLNSQDRSHDCSHPSISHAHSSQGKLLPEFLFGDRNISFNDKQQQSYSANILSDESYTWFQAEYASLFGKTAWEKVSNYLAHKLCFVIYYLTKKNVGPYGLSDYKEGNIRILQASGDFLAIEEEEEEEEEENRLLSLDSGF